MAFQPAPGVAQVKLTFDNAGQVAQNVFHVHTNASWSAEFLEGLAGFFHDFWRDSVMPIVGNACQLTLIQVRDLTTEFAGYYELTPPSDIFGEVNSPLMPGNVSSVVTWTTGLTGRSTRGRTYHVGLTESQCVNGFLENAANIALLAAYSALPGAVEGEDTDWSLRVLSRVQNGVTLAEALSYEITATTINAALDSMRKRLPGRGI